MEPFSIIAGVGLIGGIAYALKRGGLLGDINFPFIQIPLGGSSSSSNDDDAFGIPETIPDTISSPALGQTAYPRYISTQTVADIARQIKARFNLRPSVDMITTIAMLESGHYQRVGNHDTQAKRYEAHINDTSYGVMQNLYRDNARWLHDQMGYKGYALNRPEDLFHPETAIYFGAAYLDWLIRTYGGTDSQIARRYNGGPNGHRYSQTLEYWRRYKIANLEVKGNIYA